jgi:hypothetical protein
MTETQALYTTTGGHEPQPIPPYRSIVPSCALLEFAQSCCESGPGVNYLGRQQVYLYLVSLHGSLWLVQHETEVKKELATIEAMMELKEYQEGILEGNHENV